MMYEAKLICSVCIANFNGIGLIEACIDSVLAQDLVGSVEIIVHDDASTDGSADFIRARYPSVRLIESQENVGFCVANNRMSAVARGDYLLLLNNDAELFSDALRILLAEAEHLGVPAILGLPQYDAENGDLLDIGSLLDPFLNPVPNLDPQRGEVGMVMGACLWIQKSLWNEFGGFPEWFGSIGEDLFLCSLARLRGYPVRALGISGYHHHVGQSFGGGKVSRTHGLSTSVRRRALSERNKTLVMLLCYPVIWLLPLLPIHLLLLIFEGVTLSLLKRDMVIWSSIYWACLRGLMYEARRVLAERGRIQQTRIATLRDWTSAFIWFPHKLKMLSRYGLPEIRY